MEVDRNRLDEIICHGLVFVLRLALVLGGLGFASVFAVDATNEERGVERILTFGACTVKKE